MSVRPDIAKALRSPVRRKERLIKIDKGREDKDGITGLLLRGMGYTAVYEQLPLGDYTWDSKLGMVLVERKTPEDIRNIDRLVSQLDRLRGARDTGAFPILLLDYRYGGRNPWRDQDLDNLLMSLSGRIRVAHCHQGELAHRLDSLYLWSQKTVHRLFDGKA